MAHIRQDTGNNGQISYDTSIVAGIVAIAVEQVQGAYPLNTKNKGIKLTFDKKSGISADIAVKVDSCENVTKIAYQIQQSIKHNVEAMTKFKVNKVDVHIQDVNLKPAAAV
ncbi:MAG: Asp23/Gls24 family envelope stress response protein [Clostridia bacterium]|nr:Asp23/Gls24 family envelope stress response protein [Clostridia bacterium]